MATYSEIMDAAHRAHEKGDRDAARRFLEIAKQIKMSPQERVAAAKAGTLEMLPGSAERATAADAEAMALRRTWGDAIVDNVIGRDDGVQSWGETAGTVINQAIEGGTAGVVGDRAAAMADDVLGRGDYDARLQHYRDQENALPTGVDLAAQIAGAVASPLSKIGALGKAAPFWQKAATGAAVAAPAAGTYAFMEGEGDTADRLKDAGLAALLGGSLGVAAPALGGAAQKFADSRVFNRAARAAAKLGPSTERLQKIGSDLYRDVKNLGVEVKAEAFERARGGILDDLLSGTAYSTRPGGRTLTPKAAATMDDMAAMSAEMAGQPGAAIPFREIDHLRRQAGAAAGNFRDKSDTKAGMTIIGGLDDFVDNLKPGDVAAGDVKALPETINKAREIWAKMSKSQKMDDAIEAAESYRWGFSNGIKWQMRQILKNPKMSKGFSEAERRLMKKVISGTIPQKVLDLAGSGLTSVGGLVGAGLGATTGPVGVLAGLGVTGASMAARGGANALARRQAETLRSLIASGQAQNLPVAASPAYGGLIERLIRGSGVTLPAQ